MSKGDKWEKGQNKDHFNEKAEESNEERETGDGSNEEQGKGDESREEPKIESKAPDLKSDERTDHEMSGAPPGKEEKSPSHDKDDKWARGQKTPEFNEQSNGENENQKDEQEDHEEKGHDEPKPAPRPKGLGMDGGTEAEMAGAPPGKNPNSPTHSEDEIKAWEIEENTAMQSQYAEERDEMEGQHKEALENQWDLLAEKQEKEREEVISSMQAEQEADLSTFDNEFKESWAEQEERVSEAYDKGQIPEPKMGHGEGQVQEKQNDGHEL